MWSCKSSGFGFFKVQTVFYSELVFFLILQFLVDWLRMLFVPPSPSPFLPSSLLETAGASCFLVLISLLLQQFSRQYAQKKWCFQDQSELMPSIRETMGSVGDDSLLFVTRPELLHSIAAFCLGCRRRTCCHYIVLSKTPLHFILLSTMTLKNTSFSSSKEEAT